MKSSNNIGKTSQTPFPELDKEIEHYRTTLADIIKQNYAKAYNEGISPGEPSIQKNIYTDFIKNITFSRIQQFYQQYHTALKIREKKLKEDFDDTIVEIRNWEKVNPNTKKWEKYNKNLAEKPVYFLKVKAIYDGECRREEITQVEGYLSEKEMAERIKNYKNYNKLKDEYDKQVAEIKKDKIAKSEKTKQLKKLETQKPKRYIPDFTDRYPDFDIKKLRVYASMNIAVLLNNKTDTDYAWKEVKFEEYKTTTPGYVIIDRLKAGPRQASKFVDTLITDERGLTLRDKKDKSFDFAGITVKINNGEELYRLANFFTDKSASYPELDNMHTLEQNAGIDKSTLKADKTTLKNPLNKKPIQKLRKDFYVSTKAGNKPHLQLDTENFKEVMQQMLSIDKVVTQRVNTSLKRHETYRLSLEEKEGIRQGAKLGITNESFPTEVQIGTREMLQIQQYGNIRHELFIPERELERQEYLLNPINSPHRKALRKKEKTNEQKNEKEQSNDQKRLARVDVLAQLLEDLFTPAFELPDYDEDK
jgi:hypothetical protein